MRLPTNYMFLHFGRVGFLGGVRLFWDFSVLVGWFFLAGSDYLEISLFWSGYPENSSPTICLFLHFGRGTLRIPPRLFAIFFILVGVPWEINPDHSPFSSFWSGYPENSTPTNCHFLHFGRGTLRILPRLFACFFTLVGAPWEFTSDYLPVSSL